MLDIPQLQEESSPIQFVMTLKFKAYTSMTTISIFKTNDRKMKNRGHTFYRVPIQESTFPMDCSEKLHTKKSKISICILSNEGNLFLSTPKFHADNPY
jgi:hypothetical protein